MATSIVIEHKHYIYRHIREDLNVPFYIGIGTRNPKTNSYTRAYDISSRRKEWKKIHGATSIKVQIIFESNNYEELIQKEAEFIKLYGRLDRGTGTLTNLTDGGEGNPGRMVSDIARKNLSIAHLGQKPSKYTLLKKSESMKEACKLRGISPLANKIFQYSIDGIYIKTYPSAQEAESDLKVSDSKISRASLKNKHYGFGYLWYREYQGEQVTPYNNHRETKIINCIDANGKFIGSYGSILQASKGVCGTRKLINIIADICNEKRDYYKNLTFRYA